MGRILSLLSLVMLAAVPASAGTGFDVEDAPPSVIVTGSPLSVESASIAATRDPSARHAKKKRSIAADPNEMTVFGAERAQILLRSLTIPGWGQATLGKRHAAAFFGTAELGIWAAFTAFRVQEVMRTETYMRTARIYAGIELRGRNDEYLRLVGEYPSSDDYNKYVRWVADELYRSDPYHPDMAGYQAYVDGHSISGANAWRWTADAQARYASERKQAQRASIRANSMLAVAIANRVLSAAHAARGARRLPGHAEHTSWNFGFEPGRTGERVLFRTGLSARF